MAIDLEPGMLESGSFLDSVKMGAVDVDAAADAPETAAEENSTIVEKPVVETPAAEKPTAAVAKPEAKQDTAPLEDVVAGLNLPGSEASPAPPAATEAVPEPPSLAKQLDDIQLPAHARASTAAQFERLRTLSRETIQKLEQQMREAKSAAPTSALPKDVEQQLAELKTFRERAAAAGDPVFEEKFGAPIKQADEAIYDRLRKEGATEENIEAIRKLGGIENTDVDGLYRQISAGARRFIDAQILQKEQVQEQRKKAEANASQFLRQVHQEKQEQAKQQEAAAQKFVHERVTSNLDRLPQFQLKEIPSGADVKTVAQLEAYNSFVKEIRTDAVKLAQSVRPEDRADMAMAAASAVYYKVTTDGLRKTVSALQAEVAQARKQLSDIKGGSRIPPTRVLSGTAAAAEAAAKAEALSVEDGLSGKTAEDAFSSYNRMRAQQSE